MLIRNCVPDWRFLIFPPHEITNQHIVINVYSFKVTEEVK